MRIGPLRQRVQIMLDVRSGKDSSGQLVTTPTLQVMRSADIQAVNGREIFQGVQVRPDISHLITMRAWTGLKPKMYIVWTTATWGTRTFQIEYIINPGERAMGTRIVAACKEQP